MNHVSDYLDKAKDVAKDLTDKARGTVSDHSDTIDDHIDRAGAYVDDKTKGKYTDKIDSVTSKAHDVVDKIAKDDGDTKGDGGAAGDDSPSS
jgi:hypothetical protein